MTISLPQFEDANLVTNSQLAKFRTCQRRHWYEYELGIRPIRTPEALRIGQNIHAGIEARSNGASIEDAIAVALKPYSGIIEGLTQQESAYEHQEVGCLLSGYFWYWERDDVPQEVRIEKHLAAEFGFKLKVPKKALKFAGKIDGIVQLADGRIAVLETKTSSEDVSVGSKYRRKLMIDNQISGYVLAARAHGFDVTTVLYNIIRKPSSEPRRATPVWKRKYTKEGKLYANLREFDETPEEYGNRLAEMIQESPDDYYVRLEVPRLETDLNDWYQEMQDSLDQLKRARTKGYKVRNTTACTSYGGCVYLDHCWKGIELGGDVPNGFKQKSQRIHEEL